MAWALSNKLNASTNVSGTSVLLHISLAQIVCKMTHKKHVTLQGGAYLSLSLWGIVRENCQEQSLTLVDKDNLVKNPISFFVDLIYFKNKECGAITIQEGTNSYQLVIDWSTSFDITNREYIFFITYAVISVVWVVTSLIVMVTICGRMTRLLLFICFWPWFIAVMAGCILDIVATVYHVIDIIHTMTMEDALAYAGITEPPNVFLNLFTDYDSYFLIPSIIMTVISARGVVIWIINFFGACFCITLARAMLRSKKEESTNSIKLNVSPLGQQQGANPSQQTTISAQSAIQTPTPNAPDLTDISTYRNSDAHPDRLNYPPETTTPTIQLPSLPPISRQLSVISPLNKRYSSAEGLQINQSPPPRVSAELRSQLPWSYTNIIKEQQQKQQQMYPDLTRSSSTQQ